MQLDLTPAAIALLSDPDKEQAAVAERVLRPYLMHLDQIVERLIDINDHIEDTEVCPSPCVQCSRHSAYLALGRYDQMHSCGLVCEAETLDARLLCCLPNARRASAMLSSRRQLESPLQGASMFANACTCMCSACHAYQSD